jgi:hypothetical protein
MHGERKHESLKRPSETGAYSGTTLLATLLVLAVEPGSPGTDQAVRYRVNRATVSVA